MANSINGVPRNASGTPLRRLLASSSRKTTEAAKKLSPVPSAKPRAASGPAARLL